MSPDSRPRPAEGDGGKGNKMSNRDLSLIMKTIASREVRESGKAASATVAARVGGIADRSHRVVGRAHDEEKLRVARFRATRREAVYGDAVKEANMRGTNYRSKAKQKRDEAFRPPGKGEANKALKYVQEHGGWKTLSEAQAVEAIMDEEARRETLRRSKKTNAAFLSSQCNERKRKEVEAARESVAEGRRLAADALEFERRKRQEAAQERRSGRELRDSRQAQVALKEQERQLARASAIKDELREVEKLRALDRAEAWDKEQAKREAREKNRLSKEENDRLISLKAAERQESLREEHRMQVEYSAKMDADEEQKGAEMRKVKDRQTKINERMTKIYDRFKAQEECTEKRAEAEQQLEMEKDARRAQEKEMKRVHLLREQTHFLRQQERLRHHRLAEERREGLADAAEMKTSNREAYLQEKANRQRIRAEALRAQRFLQLQIADKAKARALQQESGGLTAEERALNRALLGRAAVTLGFS